MPVHVFPTRSGPKVRAGLTDEPLKGIAARWIATRVSGIAISALGPKRSLRVAWRMTSTKIAVMTNSITQAVPSEEGFVAVEATSALVVARSRISEARTAPAN